MNSLKPILVCGDAMEDEYWYGEVERISPEAPVPCVRIVRQETRPGAANNVVENCIALGAKVYPVTCYAARKIRVVGRNQQIVRIDFDERVKDTDVKWLEISYKKALQECDFVLFSDYGKGSLLHSDSLIMEAKGLGKTVLVDPKGHDYGKYAGADLIKPNIVEMREVVGGWKDEDQLQKKANALMHAIPVARLLLTRAAAGMTLFTKEERFDYPSLAQEIYDVTGAGDTAIATMAGALSRGCAWGEAVHYANKAAGIVVGKFGTAVATEKEVFG